MIEILSIGTDLRIFDKGFPIDVFRHPADEQWIEFSPVVRGRFLFAETLWKEEIRDLSSLPSSFVYRLSPANKWITLELKAIIVLREHVCHGFGLAYQSR